jgi:hypothetical protein
MLECHALSNHQRQYAITEQSGITGTKSYETQESVAGAVRWDRCLVYSYLDPIGGRELPL